MKLSFSKTLALSFIASAALFVGCVDNEKDLFDAEKIKETYQNLFPVKDIDPNMDWKTTASANVNVTVNEDFGTDYKVQIFDANPLNPDNRAKLMGEGYANQDMVFQTTIDYPKALGTVYVARVDKQGRYLVKTASIENGTITANFGSSQVTSRGATKAGNVAITPVKVPYTEQEITDLLTKATEIQQGWNLGAMRNWDSKYSNYPVFDTPNNQPRHFKITSPRSNMLAAEGSATIKVIVASKLTLTQSPSMSGSIEIIVAKGGELIIDSEFNLAQKSNFTIMPGGKISGKKISLANAASGAINYNAGDIELEEVTMTEGNGLFYNSGTFDVTFLNITNASTRLVNFGKAIVDKTNSQTTIENGCSLIVKDFNGKLRLSASSSATLDTYNKDKGDNPNLVLDQSSILYIKKAYLSDETIHGPSEGYALVKIEKIETLQNFSSEGNIYYEIKEIDDKITSNSWFNSFCEALKNSEGAISKFGESPIVIPSGDCTGEGNTPKPSGDRVEINEQIYTYAFEDNFPQAGDYDFNDIVLDVTSQYTRSIPGNQISKIQFNVTLSAVGASKRLGAGLRLVGIAPNAVANIEFEDENSMRSTLAGSMFANAAKESDKDIVIPLFGDAHKVYGQDANKRIMLNTQKSSIIEKLYVLKVIITLTDQTKKNPLITNKNLDFFIAYTNSTNSQAKRTEVHLYEFRNSGATDNGDIHDKYMAVAGKLTWAICVPAFNYPTETTVITTAYPEFGQWATTGGVNDKYKNWYKSPIEGDTQKFIFR